MSKLEELLVQYVEKFNDCFPLVAMTCTEEEIIDVIEACIATDTPYDPQYEDDCDY